MVLEILQLQRFFINCYQKFMVYFNFSFCNPNYQINPTQIIECKMGKEDHTNLFIIEESIVTKGVHKLFKPHLDVGFSTSDNSIHGSKNNY
jgi:hypothetical protein